MPRKREESLFDDDPTFWLQFGRGCYAAETQHFGGGAEVLHTASIRPRLLCRGNKRDPLVADLHQRALQFGRGCYAAETGGTMSLWHSGGTLQFGRGCYAAETQPLAPDPIVNSRFNSAAAVMPRKLVGFIAGFSQQRPLQFGRGCYAAETINSAMELIEKAAASIRPRLLCRGNGMFPDERHDRARASIRPRLLCRGNHFPRGRQHAAREELQFGRGCYAAETGGRRYGVATMSKLQFGRGCYAAETRRLQWVAGAVWTASIRPRLLCRGNDLSPSSSRSAVTSFNSAAAVMPRKRPAEALAFARPSGFNSAAAVMPRKRAHVAHPRGRPGASIRPRLLCRGNAVSAVERVRTVCASIRPRLLCRGNP